MNRSKELSVLEQELQEIFVGVVTVECKKDTEFIVNIDLPNFCYERYFMLIEEKPINVKDFVDYIKNDYAYEVLSNYFNEVKE